MSGRPSVSHSDLRDLVAQGLSDAKIAEHYGVSDRTVLRWRKAEGIASHWDHNRTREHGTAMYDRGCRCDVCRSASTKRYRDQARSRLQRTIANGWIAPVERHGYSTGINWYCRCDICRFAVSEKNRRDRARRMAVST